MIDIIYEIYESAPYPIVTHIFTGRDMQEARGYFQSHLKSDTFLRGCHESGQYGNIKCRHSVRFRRYGE
jgi:hypothetical protein